MKFKVFSDFALTKFQVSAIMPIRRSHLKRLEQSAPTRMKCVIANIEIEKSFDSAISGCEVVVFVLCTSPEMLDLGAKGDMTLRDFRNVMDAISRCSSVARVVLVSHIESITSVSGKPENFVFKETDEPTKQVKSTKWFSVCRRVEEMLKEHGKNSKRFDYVILNAGFPIGPCNSLEHLDISCETLKRVRLCLAAKC